MTETRWRRRGIRAMALVLSSACAARKAPPPPVDRFAAIDAQCAAAELTRTPDPSIRSLLGDGDPRVRGRAALAVGRIEDEGAVATLGQLLGDRAAGDLAAWALGRLPGGEPALAGCVEARCPASAAAARALGGPLAARVLSARAVAALAGALSGPAPLAAESATALGIAARNGKERDVAASARQALVAAAARPEPGVRAGAAYALGRLPRGSELDAARGAPLALALGASLADRDPLVRSLAARAWGRQGLAPEELEGALSDADWRVRVEAARGLAGNPAALGVLGPALRRAAADVGSREIAAARFAHPLVALLETAGGLGPAALSILPVPATLSGPTLASTATIRCAAAGARDRARGSVDETPACGRGIEEPFRGRLRTGVLAAELAEHAPAAVVAARVFLHDADPRVRGQTAGAAGPALAAELRALLADPDPLVVQNAAASLARERAVAVASLADANAAISRLAAAHGKRAGTPATDALAALVELAAAAKPATPPAGLQQLLPAPSVPLHAALARLLPLADRAAPEVPAEARDPLAARAKLLRLRTTAGDLVLTLRTETPLSSTALAALARRGFDDGLAWHRVVPDFVIQGADPRGDGDGGPGWALPDEHTPLRFVRGSAGIATSGPETGGSQIFVCHSPQPHLDGRYTLFAELSQGGEALDSIQPGDTILRAEVQ